MWIAPFNWSGFYAGINGGYGFGKSDWTSAATAGSAKPKGDAHTQTPAAIADRR